MRGTFRTAVVAAAVFTVAGVAAADAATVNLGTRNPRHGGTSKPTRIVSTATSYALAATDTGTGGAAALACRSTAINLPCLRTINSSSGTAFTFQTNGTLGGVIKVGAGGADAKPFTTNATGVATGLNADMLDGLNAADFLPASEASNFLTKDAAAAFLTKASASDLFLSKDAAAGFLGVSAKAADADKLDGVDSTGFLPASAASNFLGATAKAADSDKLDGLDSTDFVPVARIGLVPQTGMAIGDPPATFFSSGGIAFGATCTDAGGGTPQVDLTVDTDQDGTEATAFVPGVGGAPVTIDSADGAKSILTTDAGTANALNAVSVAISKPDGTMFTGVIGVGFNLGADDCRVGGSLTRTN